MGYRGKATGHGFRALAMSTIKEKLGYRHETVDRQLAHAHRNSVDAAYDRAQFLDERTVMIAHKYKKQKKAEKPRFTRKVLYKLLCGYCKTREMAE
jgi:integrase